MNIGEIIIEGIMQYIPLIIICSIILSCIGWFTKKLDNIDTGIKLIAKNLQIITQNQKTYFESNMTKKRKDIIEFKNEKED